MILRKYIKIKSDIKIRYYWSFRSVKGRDINA